jgi:hypothetical protein
MAREDVPLTQNEREAVTGREAAFRFEYFLLHARREGRFWLLRGEGFATLEGTQGRPLLACWPHRDFAQAMAEGAWAGFRPFALNAAAFVREGAAQMAAAGLGMLVFPVPGTAATAVTLSAPELAEQLARALPRDEETDAAVRPEPEP